MDATVASVVLVAERDGVEVAGSPATARAGALVVNLGRAAWLAEPQEQAQAARKGRDPAHVLGAGHDAATGRAAASVEQ